MRAQQRYSIVLVLGLSLLIGACGDDDSFTSPGFVTSPTSEFSVAGKYAVQLTPMGTNCVQYQPIGSVETFSVSQFGGTVYIDSVDNFGAASNELDIDIPAAQGPLYADGSFIGSSQGSFFDPFNEISGGIQQYIQGYFDVASMQGQRDASLYDPLLGGNCTVTHSFFGGKI